MQAWRIFDDCVEILPEAALSEVTLSLPAGTGVCLFSGGGDEPILLLRAANLRRLVRGRLAEGESAGPDRRTRLRPIVRRVWFRRTYSAFEAQLAFFNIAGAVYGANYKQLFGKVDTWFVHIDFGDDYPFFARTNKLDLGRGWHWGPFGSKRAAARCIEILQNVFDLCRYPDVLARAPDARPCAYAQMNRCAAVCNGTISGEHYRQIVERAVAFMNRPFAQSLAAMEEQMKTCAADLNFEEADRRKRQIAEVGELTGVAYRWVRAMAEFAVLSFQEGPRVKVPACAGPDSGRATSEGLAMLPTPSKITNPHTLKVTGERVAKPSVCPFLIGAGWVEQMEPFLLSDAEGACRELLERTATLRGQKTGQEFVASEDLFAWVANLLYKSKRHDKGLYFRVDGSLVPELLARQIEQHFTRPIKKRTSSKPQLDSLSLAEGTGADDSDKPQK